MTKPKNITRETMAEFIRNRLPIWKPEDICAALRLSTFSDGHMVDEETVVEVSPTGKVLSITTPSQRREFDDVSEPTVEAVDEVPELDDTDAFVSEDEPEGDDEDI